jgi:hypothetical protein
MKFMTLICGEQSGEPSFNILERRQTNDGNPINRFRRGDDGVFQCLVDDYGIEAGVARALILEAKVSGSVEC